MTGVLQREALQEVVGKRASQGKEGPDPEEPSLFNSLDFILRAMESL